MRVPVAAVLLMLLPCMLHGADAAAVRWHKKPLFPAIFSFGDSYADTGNYAVLEGDRPFNYSPYGETTGRPTGRASDGLLVIDYVAKGVDLPLVPPYLAKGQNFSEGANFAVIGARALDQAYFLEQNVTSPAPMTNSSLAVQLRWFEELKPSLCRNATKRGCRDYLDRQLPLRPGRVRRQRLPRLPGRQGRGANHTILRPRRYRRHRRRRREADPARRQAARVAGERTHGVPPCHPDAVREPGRGGLRRLRPTGASASSTPWHATTTSSSRARSRRSGPSTRTPPSPTPTTTIPSSPSSRRRGSSGSTAARRWWPAAAAAAGTTSTPPRSAASRRRRRARTRPRR
ncbi:hypothetical protein PVAP13_5KG031200 [Panicum virgatum]|uniref:GDSL esterase/lipase n=1 Tax=Panicum virgatum TaxID=38727 RepID=A0A8T0S8F3_PANVG|nr:hypothetical protein PVAP13_5KG031200 [Panicum virgatum]